MTPKQDNIHGKKHTLGVERVNLNIQNMWEFGMNTEHGTPPKSIDR